MPGPLSSPVTCGPLDVDVHGQTLERRCQTGAASSSLTPISGASKLGSGAPLIPRTLDVTRDGQAALQAWSFQGHIRHTSVKRAMPASISRHLHSVIPTFTFPPAPLRSSRGQCTVMLGIDTSRISLPQTWSFQVQVKVRSRDFWHRESLMASLLLAPFERQYQALQA